MAHNLRPALQRAAVVDLAQRVGLADHAARRVVFVAGDVPAAVLLAEDVAGGVVGIVLGGAAVGSGDRRQPPRRVRRLEIGGRRATRPDLRLRDAQRQEQE